MILVCPRCNNKWEYTGNLVLASCSSCGLKVKTGRDQTKKKIGKVDDYV